MAASEPRKEVLVHALRDHRPRRPRGAREAPAGAAGAPGAPGPAGARGAHPAGGPAPRPHRQPDRPRGRLARRGLGAGRARPLRHRGRLQPRRGEAVPAGAAIGAVCHRAARMLIRESMGPSPDDLTLLAARRARIMEKMGGGVMLLAAAPERPRTADILYPYRQDSDFAYVTGFPEPEAVCVLAPDAKERFVLFVRPRDPERELWVGTRAGVDGAVERYGADAAFKLEDLERELPRFLEKAPQVWHTVRRDDPLAQRLMALIRRAQEMQPRTGTGPTTIREPGDLLHEMRLRKEPAELAHMREAIAIACDAHREAMRSARPGMYEYEIEALIDFTFRRRGATGPAYPSIVASGANATVLHYTDNDRPLGERELLLIDAGAERAGYCADVTRTIPTGPPSEPAQRDLYDAGLAAQPGMVLTVEPGLYIPAGAEDVPAPYRGVGIRIEDDVLVTEAGCEVLSAAAPKQVAEVEALRAEAS